MFYPEIISMLPDADIPFVGVKGKILQSSDYQMVFFEIDGIGKVPEHSHGAQWGVVLSGTMELTIDGITKTYTKGDSYFIPKDRKHSACFREKTFVLDLFADRDRYPVKSDPD